MKSLWISVSLVSLAGLAAAEQPGFKPRVPQANVPRNPLPPAPLVGGGDDCSVPDLITGTGGFAFDNSAATTNVQGQGEGACLAFGSTAVTNDVWFVWTAPSSGVCTIDTCATGTTVDTKIAIYPSPAPGGGCPTAAALACNDDACAGFQSTLSAIVSTGFEYMIQVGTYPFPAGVGAAGGLGTFTISINPVLPNDDCSTPTTITGFGPGTPFNYDTTTATTGTQGQNNAVCNIFATRLIQFDLWYEWTSPVTGWVRLTGCSGMIHDGKVAVYTGSGCPVIEPVACDDDACGTIGSSAEARWLASMGQVYTIQLGSYPGQGGQPGFFTIESFTPAVGDDCAAPILIAGPGPHAFDNTFATTGTSGQNEALCTTVGDTNPRIAFDLWYKWTAPSTGTATVSLCAGASLDSKIAAYKDTTCPTSPALACNDDFCLGGGPSQVSFAVQAGESYMIQIGDWPGSIQGSGVFSISWTTAATGTAYCFGDGTGTLCPCQLAAPPGGTGPIAPGLPTNGCPNSVYAGGAYLWAEGQNTFGSDFVTLRGTGMPNSSCLYFQGTAQPGAGLGTIFGDGLRCTTTGVVRLGTKTNVNGSSQYPVGLDLPVSVKGLVPSAGTTRHYQAWYRNAALFCAATSTFNLTNGVTILWN